MEYLYYFWDHNQAQCILFLLGFVLPVLMGVLFSSPDNKTAPQHDTSSADNLLSSDRIHSPVYSFLPGNIHHRNETHSVTPPPPPNNPFNH